MATTRASDLPAWLVAAYVLLVGVAFGAGYVHAWLGNQSMAHQLRACEKAAGGTPVDLWRNYPPGHYECQEGDCRRVGP